MFQRFAMFAFVQLLLGSDKLWGTLLVAQLFEALRYKSEGCGFDSQWCQWNFSLT